MTRGDMYEIACVLCERYSATMSSAYRSHAHNQRVGGSENSWHLQGIAFDIEPDDRSDLEHIANDARRFGLRAITYTKHVHVQPD